MLVVLRNSFKSFTSLKQNVRSDLIDDLMGYNLDIRSSMMSIRAADKWRLRKEGCLYKPIESENVLRSCNLCKNQPKSMIKYINMQIALCARCKSNNVIVRCNKDHLEAKHGIVVDSVYEIADKVKDLVKADNNRRKTQKQNRSPKLTRKKIMNYADEVIQRSIEKAKVFLIEQSPTNFYVDVCV